MPRTAGQSGRRIRRLDRAHPVESAIIAVTDGDTHVAYWSREEDAS